MQTYSHLLVAAWVGEASASRRAVRRVPLWIGGVLPDLPLYLLTFGFFFERWQSGRTPVVAFGRSYNELFFGDPLWIVTHNFFHAPIVLGTIALIAWLGHRSGQPWAPALAWFDLGASLHSVADIFTHHTDGPLLLFPFDLSFRYQSPISYWDPRYHAGIVSPIEHALDAAIVLFLLRCWWMFRSVAEAEEAAPV